MSDSLDLLSRRRFLRHGAAALAGCTASGFTGPAMARDGAPWRMKLAFSSVMLAELPVEDVCRLAAEWGFEAIDLWCPFDRCRHLADVAERLGADGLRHLLDRHRLKLASFTTYRTRQESVGFPAYARLIGSFGGGVVVRESEYVSGDGDLSAVMRAFFERLKPQIELAKETGSRLAIENHSGALLHTPASFKAFVDLNPAPAHVGLAVAPYHLQGIKASIPEVITIAGSQLLFYYAWQQGDGMNQLPGNGSADFTPWIEALAEVGYQGYVNPFLHGHPETDELKAALAKACGYLAECRAKASR